jgi:hypothetical protein
MVKEDICILCTRCVGYYFDCEYAVKVALFDTMLWENDHYKYIVIEEVPEGTHPYKPGNQLWLNNKGNVIDTPDDYKNICCVGIG